MVQPSTCLVFLLWNRPFMNWYNLPMTEGVSSRGNLFLQIPDLLVTAVIRIRLDHWRATRLNKYIYVHLWDDWYLRVSRLDMIQWYLLKRAINHRLRVINILHVSP